MAHRIPFGIGDWGWLWFDHWYRQFRKAKHENFERRFEESRVEVEIVACPFADLVPYDGFVPHNG
jgi:hypothetical protein